MRNPIAWLALTFFAFILWIIYLADTGSPMLFAIVNRLPYGDKVAHLLLYGLLTLVLNLALELRTLQFGRLRVYFGTVAVTLFALCEELSQAWFPARTLDVQDLVADAVGIAGFSLLSLGIHRWRLGKVRQRC